MVRLRLSNNCVIGRRTFIVAFRSEADIFYAGVCSILRPEARGGGDGASSRSYAPAEAKRYTYTKTYTKQASQQGSSL